jgi:hypothetical protein
VESCDVGEAEFELIDSTDCVPVKICPFLSLAMESRQGTVFESGHIVKWHFDRGFEISGAGVEGTVGLRGVRLSEVWLIEVVRVDQHLSERAGVARVSSHGETSQVSEVDNSMSDVEQCVLD